MKNRSKENSYLLVGWGGVLPIKFNVSPMQAKIFKMLDLIVSVPINVSYNNDIRNN